MTDNGRAVEQSDWREATLGECAKLIRDSVSPSDMSNALYIGLEHIGEGTLSLLGQGVTSDVTSTKARFRRGDILFGKLRPYFRKVVRAPANGLCSTDIWVVRAKDGVDQNYLYYSMASQQFVDFATAGSEGTKMPRAIWEYVSRYVLPIPPLPDQQAISHVLGTLDDKIELNRRMNETLEEMARALFKSWFVDFDPVRAKMDGRWRRGESLPGLPADLYDLFPDRLVTSELGEIPDGWEVKALGDVIEFHDSKRIPLNSRQRSERQGPYPYYGAAGIMDYVDDFLFDGVYVLAGEDGSVVDTDGHPIMQYVWGQFWVNNHAHVLRGRNGIGEEHLYSLLQQVNIMAFVTGAVQPKLSQRNLKAVPIVFPGDPACRAFSTLVGPLFERVRDITDEAESLAIQRDALLPKLVSGEVCIPVH